MGVISDLGCLRLDCFAFSCPSPSKKTGFAQNGITFPVQLRIVTVHLRTQSSTCEVSTKAESFTVEYLVNSCGLSVEAAKAASRSLRLSSPERPDSVLTLLRDHGFSKTQISRVVKRRPRLLLAHPERTLLPKLEFFYSRGFSKADLAKILNLEPTILARSLERRIVPSCDFLKNILLSDKKMISSLKRASWILLRDYSKNLTPNIEVLKELDVPPNCIALLLAHFPEALVQRCDKFREAVNEASELGFHPKKSTFVLAVHALSGEANKSIWKRCFEVYRRLGWSSDDIFTAFRKHPHCMMLSEKKIMKAMDFFVNNMGLASREISESPTILFLSLEKRIIPRWRVVQVLSSRSLIKKEFSLNSVFLPTEKGFLERFVTKFEEELPDLLMVYEGKMNPEEV